MAKFLIHKSGPLSGCVDVSGSKNAVLPILAASILADGPCEISDVPRLKDVEVMCEILERAGAEVKKGYECLTITPGSSLDYEVPYALARKMRASVLMMGPLLAKAGIVRAYLPGGCAIGERPIDLHLKGFQALGAVITETENYVEAKAEKLVGSEIYLDFPSVGATENIMMAAVFAKGVTIVENVAEEPEIVDLANFLNRMGARIKGAGTDTIKIEGVASLHATNHVVIPDRIEMGTFMVAAAITRGNILIRNGLQDHVRPVIAKLRECGVVIEDNEEGMTVRGDLNPLVATDIKTLPYPGFATDMQPQFMALLATVNGSSKVIETVFENRFMHVSELNRMGADIRVEGKDAYISGGKQLHSASVIAPDLRAGAALVLAGLAADGITELSEIFHIERGYADFIGKFAALGAQIERIEDGYEGKQDQ